MPKVKRSSKKLDLELIKFYRKNPIIAAHDLLIRNGKSVRLLAPQQKLLTDWWNSNFGICTASRGFGKALRLDAQLLTPSGFIEMRDVEIGTDLLSPDGEVQQVTEIYPQGELDTFEVIFSDGRTIECCENHLWKVKGLNCSDLSKWEVHKTSDIKEYLETKAKIRHSSVRIPLVEDIFVQKDDLEVPIHPYVIGALIGDGCLTHRVGFSSSDRFILDKLQDLTDDNIFLTYRGNYDYALIDEEYGKNSLMCKLKELGMFGRKSYEKNIPELYLNLSKKQTLEMIQGLMDTDGTIHRNGSLSYTTTSKKLAEQVQTLIWKLGGICKLSSRTTSYTHNCKKQNGRESYRLIIRYKHKHELISLPRKKELVKDEDQYSNGLALRIKAIYKKGKAECQCITVNGKDHLFITDNYLVTHNTFVGSVFVALKCLLYPGVKVGLIAPSFRQSKLIFAEFKQFYDDSPLLQAEIKKPPTVGTDRCECIFKSRPGYRPSTIIALPVGSDGGKIRGSRFNIVIIDECIHLPENIFRAAIRPMLSTTLDPIENVEREEKIAAGLIDPSEDEGQKTNGFFAITSGYYKFNYWWKIIESFNAKILQAKKDNVKPIHSLQFVPYYHMPKGFFQEHIISEAKADDPEHIFLTEWCAYWIDDSSGAFKMSLLRSCQSTECIPKTIGDPTKEYIVGIDPARNNDSSALVIVEVGFPCKLIYIQEQIDVPWPQQAENILNLLKHYNVKAIYLDTFGGGQTLADSFADKNLCNRLGVDPIVEVNLPPGAAAGCRRLLHMITPSSTMNTEVNDSALKVLEEHWLIMPPSMGELCIPTGKKNSEGEEIEKLVGYEIWGNRKTNEKDRKGNTVVKRINLVEELINQTAAVVVTETKTGRLNYDLPKRKGTVGSETLDALQDYKKDLYSAFILAAKAVYDLEFVPRHDIITLAAGFVREAKRSRDILPPHRGVKPEDYTSNNNMANSSSAVTVKKTKSGGTITTFPQGGIVVSRGNRKHGSRRR